MTITKDFCKLLNVEIAAAMAAIAEKHALTVENRGGTYDATTFTPRIKFSTTDAGATTWNRWARLFDLPDDLVGKILRYGGDRYRITGLNPDAPKYPINVEREPDGKKMRFTVDPVWQAYGHWLGLTVEKEASHDD
jgi:hypothetical protein